MSLEIVKLNHLHSSTTVQHTGTVTPHTVLAPHIRTVKDALEVIKKYSLDQRNLPEFEAALDVIEAFINTR